MRWASRLKHQQVGMSPDTIDNCTEWNVMQVCVCVCVCVCAPCWRSSGWRRWSGPGPRWTAPPPGSWRWSERTGRLWPWAPWNPPCGRSPSEANAPLQTHKCRQMTWQTLSDDKQTQQVHTCSVGVGDVVLSVLQVELAGVQLLHDAGHVVGHQLQRAGGRLGLAQHG